MIAYSFLPDEEPDISQARDASTVAEDVSSPEPQSAQAPKAEIQLASLSEEVITEEVTKTVSVGKGDTLMKLLTRSGANTQDSYDAIVALSEKYNPRQLKIGQDVKLSFLKEDRPVANGREETFQLVSVSLKEDVDREVAAIRQDDGFSVKETVIELEKKMARAGGTIENSLFLSAAQSGLPTRVTLELIRIFSFDVDFQREIQAGDKFEVYFERFVDENGTALKEGRILWASLTLSGDEISLYRFKTKDDGFTDYYGPNGQSVRKTLMRTPIDGARLTSRFGKRKHPILGYTKMHRGADFGAPRGTPIMAAGNGVVEMAARNGAYGNYVRIRHTSEYKTAYAHMKGYAKGIRKGARVKQGQIIGYVGTTGRSTGPHLHYEVLKSGRQINPLSVKLPAGRKLKGKMMNAFKSHMKQMNKDIAALPMLNKVASLEEKPQN
ncbi:peptidoglycan DD-metalloendopeptidase family protein [Sneathiella sp. P13V-1]|nr:peptidoglycan DD-metalloendopeptidase family protein [Sneathiella sp. P13V-1]